MRLFSRLFGPEQEGPRDAAGRGTTPDAAGRAALALASSAPRIRFAGGASPLVFLFSLFRTLTIQDRAREWPLTGPLRRGALSQYGYGSRVIVQFV